MPLRRRLTSVAIALLINILILLGLFQLAPAIQGRKDGHGLTTFSVTPSNDDKAASQKKASQTKATKATKSTTPRKPTLIKPTVEPPVLPPSKLPSNFIPLSSNEFAVADVSKLPTHGEASGAAQGTGASGDSSAVGNGPHGEPLYNAEWYREPTNAELDFYVKNKARQGAWAEIACQTAARFHVENCEILGDSPLGSGLGRAIADAAWQFLVRPPRTGGKAMIGAWVRIRISFDREGDLRGR